jgi:predicted cupin superfamily sugar epimerase
MTDTVTADTLIASLALRPHPEGGLYREVFRSAMPVTTADARGPRTALTAIHFLLRAGEQSRWHRVSSDEVWHHSAGAPMELLLITPDLTRAEIVTLGRIDEGHTPFHVVPADWWQAARPAGDFSMCSCMVGPGFDFADFTFMDAPADQARVREAFPAFAALI